MNQEKIYDIAIVGGGIVGVATLYQMQLKFPQLKILLIEKEDHLAAHQTGNNSGVIHSGLYYKPGSQKAITCVRGRRALVKFSKEYKVDHEVCGKVVVATEEAQLPFMEKIFANGLANDTEDIEKITGDQVREIEPFCNSIGGIRVGCTGIINYVQATDRMAELALAMEPESKVSLGDAFIHANQEGGVSVIKTEKTNYKAKHMIYCGGLQSDRLAKDDGVELDMQIVGFRGDYYELNDQGKHKVKHLIYPVPNPAFPFL